MDDLPKIVEYEKQAQNGLNNIRIVSCRSLASDEKKLFVNSSKNQILGDGTRSENEFTLSGADTLCSNVSSSAGRSLHNYSNTSKTAEISSNCGISKADISICQMKKEKASITILSAANKRKQEHINSVTKNSFSSGISPVAVLISRTESSSLCFTKSQETSPSDSSVSVVTSISNGLAHSAKSVLMSITDLCNRLPDLPPEQQTNPSFPKVQNPQAQAPPLKTHYENSHYKQAPARRQWHENLPTQERSYISKLQLKMEGISKRDKMAANSIKEQNCLNGDTYPIPQSLLLSRQKPESYLGYQEENSSKVGDKTFCNNRTQGNVPLQSVGIPKQDLETSYAVEQEDTQQEEVVDSKRLKLNESVFKEIAQHRNNPPPSNDLYYVNQVYRGSQQIPGNGFDDVSRFYCPIQSYDTQSVSTNVYYTPYNGMYEGSDYAVTRDCANYSGYQNYSDYDPNCDCEQCCQIASYYSMNLHYLGTDIGGWDHQWAVNSRLSQYRDTIMSDNYFSNTLLDDAYNEMSALIPGPSPTMINAGPSKYTELLAVIEELGKDIRPTYAGSKNASERLKKGIMHARALVRECLIETERCSRQ